MLGKVEKPSVRRWLVWGMVLVAGGLFLLLQSMFLVQFGLWDARSKHFERQVEGRFAQVEGRFAHLEKDLFLAEFQKWSPEVRLEAFALLRWQLGKKPSDIPVPRNGLHALPGECSDPELSLPLDLRVRFWFGVPDVITGPIVEFGGNLGADLKEFLGNYPTAEIFSFEPMPEIASKLRKLPVVVEAGDRVHIISCGVGGKTENVTFSAGDIANGVAASGYRSNSTGNSTAGNATWVLPIVAITDVMELVEWHTASPPMALSFNCEGCEYLSMLSFVKSRYLAKTRYIQISWHLAEIDSRRKIRCEVEGRLKAARYRRVYHSYFGWEGWVLQSDVRPTTS